MKKIWFDVSGIYNWQGNFTGIQRIVYNLAQELEKSDDAAHFFIYHAGSFIEITFSNLEQRLKEIELALSQKNKKTKKLHRENISLSKIQHYTVKGLKDTVRETRAEPVLRGVYVNSRTVYRNFRGIKSIKRTSIFRQEDIVIVVDGNWQFNGYAKSLRIAKSKISFKLVHFIHDLTAIKNPALASIGANKIITNYFTTVFDYSDLLITISEATKRDTLWFIEEYGIQNRPKIQTLVMGDNLSTDAIEPRKPKVELPQEYILAVSTIEIRKNYLSLYYAYKLGIERKLKLPNLIIVGKKGWMAEEVYALLTKDPEIKKQITILHSITDQELAWLYSKCTFTVFPSFYEGWGLPIIESFAYHKACICSNTSSMPEAGGTLAIYISPYNPEELMNKIYKLNAKPQLRQEIEEGIRNNYKTHTWTQTFNQLSEILDSTL